MSIVTKHHLKSKSGNDGWILKKQTPKVRAGINMYSGTTTGLHQIRAPDKFWHQSSSVIKNVVRETEI